MQKIVFLIFLTVCILICEATPKDRVKDEDLSNEVHWKKVDEEHNEHNPEYDHEAFLGKKAAREFEELTPEESKNRLGQLFHKVDKNGDGAVTEEELKEWIQFTQNKYIWEDAEKQMKQNDLDKDGQITWDEYKKSTYGFMDDSDNNAEQYKDMLGRDERRFKRADKNEDGKLNNEEFASFLHPENHDHMKGLVIDETLEDIDKDKDGSISLDEYIGDLWPEEDRDGEEPEWVKTEKEQFANFRDKNKDGKMDKQEVADWILPPDYDHVSSEAKHLIMESDTDKDGKVSKEEMVDKYDLYVGSQATDFGEALKYKHEDL
ncbi:calumenin-like [Hydractinia symbiolongicarpus]|uniref:calumenin-like n=1 Tax=Hydractinia symbiolongicarpus TaxID=13093 RepID=UPI00254D95B9|nr:calumenin-like [Hydractinia symbiolongicarpus]